VAEQREPTDLEHALLELQAALKPLEPHDIDPETRALLMEVVVALSNLLWPDWPRPPHKEWAA
jgi:hypothetical protein